MSCSSTQENCTKRLVYETVVADNIILYYLTIFQSSDTKYYGVNIEKGAGLETAGVLLSESEEDALSVLKTLFEGTVTPISFFEVIDQAAELSKSKTSLGR